MGDTPDQSDAPPYPDIGQPCGGFDCDGSTDLCVDCDRELGELRKCNGAWPS